MLFWIIAALLTLGASLAVLMPLARRQAPVARPQDHDLEVYRDQLAELQRDAARGLIQPAEVSEARAEIGRRILKSADPAGPPPARPSRGSRALGAAAVLAVPLVSWSLYTGIGSPELPAQPLAERLAQNPEDQSIEELLARAESHLAANPTDGRGWEVVAPVYLRMGRFDDAVAAYRSVIGLLGSSAERQANLGEALTNAAGGVVTEAAGTAFDLAVAANPVHPKARFYLATGLAQEGKLEEAASAWRAMLEGMPAETPWRGAVTEALAEVERREGGDAMAKSSPGPDQTAIDAVSAMSPADRTAMIESMVASLDQKLRENPRDVDGWMRLVRSYMVLDKAQAARDALARGLRALDGTTEEGKRLATFAASVGLAATE